MTKCGSIFRNMGCRSRLSPRSNDRCLDFSDITIFKNQRGIIKIFILFCSTKKRKNRICPATLRHHWTVHSSWYWCSSIGLQFFCFLFFVFLFFCFVFSDTLVIRFLIVCFFSCFFLFERKRNWTKWKTKEAKSAKV